MWDFYPYFSCFFIGLTTYLLSANKFHSFGNGTYVSISQCYKVKEGGAQQGTELRRLVGNLGRKQCSSSASRVVYLASLSKRSWSILNMTKMNMKAPAESPINKYLFFRGEEVNKSLQVQDSLQSYRCRHKSIFGVNPVFYCK